ncbi:MAG: glucosamine-6-phosphate deaminase [Acidimicrobiales bacterium]
MTPVAAYRVDDLEVAVCRSQGELAGAAAGRAAAAIAQAVEQRGVANAMFATGNSQLAFVAQLVATPGVPWGDVVVFHMDEYVGIDPAHPAGFARWIRQRLVEPTRPRAAHLLDGLAEPAAECARYARLLAEHPLDLCCLGIGENGHLAFNDPGVARFDDPVDVKVVELDAACRRQQVGEGHFPTVDDVPARAVTVTVPALLRATTVVAVVPEARKAEPVRRALEGPVDPDCPASALRRTAGATLYLDAGSAGLLRPPASH